MPARDPASLSDDAAVATEPPAVLVLAGLDPSGGAGLAADIETLAALGCHAAPVATALTVQDTVAAYGFQVVDPNWILRQVRCCLDDLSVRAIKLGMLADPAIVDAIIGLLAERSPQPVVLDPVMAAGGGGRLARDRFVESLRRLLPHVTLLTPNGPEARILTGRERLDDCARALLEMGSDHVLVTGGHEAGEHIVNRLYGSIGLVASWQSARLPGEFHGTGCTLASAIAASLASGQAMVEAIESGIGFVERSLAKAYPIGRGQRVPARGGYGPRPPGHASGRNG